MNRDYNKKGSPATSIVQPSSTVFSNPVVYLNNGKPIYGHWKIWTMLLLYGIGLKMEKNGTSFLGIFRLSRYEIHGMKWNWLVLWNQIWLIYVNIWYNMVNSQYMESHYMVDMVNIWMLFFPSYWEFHHTNWRSPSFFRGVGIPPTRHGMRGLLARWIWPIRSFVAVRLSALTEMLTEIFVTKISRTRWENYIYMYIHICNYMCIYIYVYTYM